VAKFEIFALDVGAGQLAISPVPGRFGTYADDLAALAAWGANLVVSLTSDAEMAQAGADRMANDLAAKGIAWRPWTITDCGVPDPGADWAGLAADTGACLDKGQRVLVHCKGGCGRSGMVVLRLIIAHGESADQALKKLRHIRPCAVETDAQMDWARQG